MWCAWKWPRTCWVPRSLVEGNLDRFSLTSGRFLRENPQEESQADPVDLGKTGEGKALVLTRKVESGARKKKGQ